MTLRIVTFCNADYIPVAKNWLQALTLINMEASATVISLDEDTRRAFPSHLVLHRPLSPKGNGLGALWSHRLIVLRDLLSAGAPVVHSDADAVWLRDPMPDIDECAAPVVFTQGTIWPKDVYLRHGLVLCCGFFYLSPHPQVLRLLDLVIDRVQTDQDDQISINRVVAERIERWEIEDPYQIHFKESLIVASRRPIRARSSKGNEGEVHVAVLPHHAYPRLLDDITSETVVAHPLSGKTLEEKEKCLRSLGLWLV